MIVAVDTFSRPDGPLGVAPSGQTWEVSEPSWAIVGGRARRNSGPNSTHYQAVIDLGRPGHSVEASVPGITSSIYAGLVLRWAGVGDHWLCQWRQGVNNDPAAGIWVCQAGTYTRLAPIGPALTQGGRLGAVADGEHLVARLNGALVAYVRSPVHATATRAGLDAQYPTLVSYDDVVMRTHFGRPGRWDGSAWVPVPSAP